MPADIGASTLQGIRSGVEGFVGSLGDASKISGDIASWGAEKLGMSPDAQKIAESVGRRLPTLGLNIPAPTTSQVSDVVKDYIGPDYEPKSKTGEAFQSIGEFIPSAVTGPGGLIRRGAMAVVPGLAVEAAGEATGDNPYAETAAGIASGILTAGRGRAGTKEMLKEVGSTNKAYQNLKKEVKGAYDELRNAGIKYDAQSVDSVINDLATIRMNPNLAPKSFGLREEFAKFAGKQMDFEDLDEMEVLAGKIARSSLDETDQGFANRILGKIRELREKGSIVTNGKIPSDEVNYRVKKAKELARRNIIARDIENMKNKSEWYKSGEESGLRSKFASYGQRDSTSLSDAEKTAFQSVLRREGVLNPLHTAGGRLGQLIIGSTGFATLGGLPGAIASVIGSNLARKFMEVYTKSGVDTAMKTVLAGRSAQERAAVLDAISKNQANLRSGLTAVAATRPAREELVPLEIEIPGGDLPVSAAEEPAQQASGGRIARKSGGRTTGNAISAEVKRVRALLSEKTASMLSVPDDAIATALHLAKRT
jgi:hypothetical protein